jgi:hypothetical protein
VTCSCIFNIGPSRFLFGNCVGAAARSNPDGQECIARYALRLVSYCGVHDGKVESADSGTNTSALFQTHNGL